MRARPVFTAAEDAVIGEMRAAGASWRAIGERLDRSHLGCRRRWVKPLRHQGGRVAHEPATCAPRAHVAPSSGKVLRGAMDAGDPVSWGAITVGTLLAGCIYRPGTRRPWPAIHRGSAAPVRTFRRSSQL